LSTQITNSVCPICGKDRIVSKTYKERIGNSVVQTTLTICPDPKCQAKLNVQLEKEKVIRDGMRLAAERRLLEQKQRRSGGFRKTSRIV